MTKLNDEVVLMSIGPGFAAPIQHNTAKSPKHPCRGQVLKIGRKLIHVDTIGAAWKVPLLDELNHAEILEKKMWGNYAVPVAVAKDLYRKSLTDPARGGWRTAKFIDDCVSSL